LAAGLAACYAETAPAGIAAARALARHKTSIAIEEDAAI
jgi:hypothetical protein